MDADQTSRLAEPRGYLGRLSKGLATRSPFSPTLALDCALRLYPALGPRLIRHSDDQKVPVEARPARRRAGSVGGGT